MGDAGQLGLGADRPVHELGVHTLGLVPRLADDERPDDEVTDPDRPHVRADLLDDTDVLVPHQQVVLGGADSTPQTSCRRSTRDAGALLTLWLWNGWRRVSSSTSSRWLRRSYFTLGGMSVKPPRREDGRTLIDYAPDQLVWALSARESKTVSGRDADEVGQVDYQLSDLRAFVKGIGGRIEREVPEPNVSSFKRKRVRLPDGTFGYRVVRPDWEEIMTALRRGECNALAAVDIDRATRDPRILEDLIDVVELYGVYVVSMTGNIDLSTDAGIDSARSLVNQRNSESRNTSRRVTKGKRRAAQAGKNHGGRMRPFGWRKDRLTLNKREAAHLQAAVPRIIAGVSPLTLAQEWNRRGIKTVTGAPWRAATIRNMYFRPRICGYVTHHGGAAG